MGVSNGGPMKFWIGHIAGVVHYRFWCRLIYYKEGTYIYHAILQF